MITNLDSFAEVQEKHKFSALTLAAEPCPVRFSSLLVARPILVNMEDGIRIFLPQPVR